MKCVRASVLVGLMTLLCGCPKNSPSPTPQPPRPAGGNPAPPARVRYALAVEGLPTDGRWKCDPAIGDVNGDGHRDLVLLPRLGGGPRAWLGDGAGRWRESSQGLAVGDQSCGGGLELLDLNGDGRLDLLTADHCNGLHAYLGDGQGGWELVARDVHPDEKQVPGGRDANDYIGAEDLAAGDVNGDGHVDVVAVSSGKTGLWVYHGDGTGRNWTWASIDLPREGWAVRAQLVDVNGDGKLDIVATHQKGPRVWLAEGPDQWKAASEGLPTPSIGGIYLCFDMADVNEDGRLDLVASNWVDGPEVYFQQADGRWVQSQDVFPDLLGGSYGLDTGDLDGDGHVDIVITGRKENEVGFVYGVFVLLGDGKGGWTWARDTGLVEHGLARCWGVRIGDLNGDERPDLVVGSGGAVATDMRRSEPVVPERILVWLGTPVK